MSAEKKWPYQQIEKPNRGSLAILLLRAAPEYPDAHYEAALKNVAAEDLAANEERLLFRTAPIPDRSVRAGSARTEGK
jgi:hypothetical protein